MEGIVNTVLCEMFVAAKPMEYGKSVPKEQSRRCIKSGDLRLSSRLFPKQAKKKIRFFYFKVLFLSVVFSNTFVYVFMAGALQFNIAYSTWNDTKGRK